MVSRSRVLTSSTLPPCVLGLLGALVALLAAGCNGVSVSGASDDNPLDAAPTVKTEYSADASDAGPAEAPLNGGGASTATVAQPYQGNSLCHASRSIGCCYPDDLANAQTCAQAACQTASDGGTQEAAGAYVEVALGCHVVPAAASSDGAADAGIVTACLPGAQQGIDGAPCRGSEDCAPAYECVGLFPTCQRYCCGGNKACPSVEFCDIQAMASSPQTKVPVCMLMEGCVLLAPLSSCAEYETCAVVRDDGATSCVAIGGAQAGESCETDHCARGLVCLGATGARSCYALCHTAPTARDCAPNQKCLGGLPLFPDPEVGICH